MSMTETNKSRNLNRWAVPVVAVVIGVAYLVSGLAGGNTFFAFFGFGLMIATGAVFLLVSRYSETAAGLRDRNDERINSIDRDATLFAGMVLIAAVIVMFVVEIAQGEDGMPYSLLGALGGLAYLGALIVLRYRR